MAKLTITFDVSSLTSDQIASKINFGDAQEFMVTLANLVRGQASGNQPLTSVHVMNGGVCASGTVTFSSTGPIADDTVTVNGVAFTGKASGATGNQWNVSTTPSVNATRLAAAINASATAGIVNVVTASASGDVVTITAVNPGVVGNSIALAESATNTAVSGAALAGGSNGTVYSY